MSIPADFRRVLESGDPAWSDGERPNLVLVYGGSDNRFLEGFTVKAADERAEKIERLPESRLKRKLVRQYISKSIPIQIDPDGRLVIPQRHRDIIGLDLETNAVFVGTLRTFQIWSEAEYEDYLEEDDGDEDLGFDLDPGTAPLDALDIVLRQLETSKSEAG
ncbi:division/cell wall cluster transcriptional repressor MraZ [Marinibacterium sp. SX1]|uniref:division/cell wall cluster transcriptional repressor MraZ n=1 Tax=Marinibacterium sp. SX1 TaxID=3388424 RepID=UPI003D182AF7